MATILMVRFPAVLKDSAPSHKTDGEEQRADRWFVYWLGSPELEDDRVFRAPSPRERTGFRTMLDAVQWVDQRLAEAVPAA